jgi:hypothetical protein
LGWGRLSTLKGFPLLLFRILMDQGARDHSGYATEGTAHNHVSRAVLSVFTWVRDAA